MTDQEKEMAAVGPTGGSSARYTAVAVGLVVVALIILLAVRSGDDDSLVGKKAPEVAGTTITGEKYQLSEVTEEGKWVVVNFFAVWCPGCEAEHPDLVAFHRWANESGKAELVAVLHNETPERAQGFFATNGGGWPAVIGPRIANDYRVTNIPETFLVDPSGQVSKHFVGEVTAKELIAHIEASS